MNSSTPLNEQVVVVTGAVHDLGRAFAIGCARQVVVADIRDAGRDRT